MGTLPWILVPAMLVPVGFLVHVVIAAKLRTVSQAVGAMAVAG
jgi:Na+/pantothenate symporter